MLITRSTNNSISEEIAVSDSVINLSKAFNEIDYYDNFDETLLLSIEKISEILSHSMLSSESHFSEVLNSLGLWCCTIDQREIGSQLKFKILNSVSAVLIALGAFALRLNKFTQAKMISLLTFVGDDLLPHSLVVNNSHLTRGLARLPAQRKHLIANALSFKSLNYDFITEAQLNRYEHKNISEAPAIIQSKIEFELIIAFYNIKANKTIEDYCAPLKDLSHEEFGLLRNIVGKIIKYPQLFECASSEQAKQILFEINSNIISPKNPGMLDSVIEIFDRKNKTS